MNAPRFLIVLAMLACAFAGLAQQAPDPRITIGPPQGSPLTGQALEEQTKRVASVLRCPVCQGLSVNDSPADMAVSMKQQVRELVALGYTEEQILSYFEKSYGEFVRLEPPLRGVNWLVWIIPVLFAIGGAFGVWRFLNKSRGESSRGTALPDDRGPDRDVLPDDPELAKWVLRARELAYGWPDGRSPESRVARGD